MIIFSLKMGFHRLSSPIRLFPRLYRCYTIDLKLPQKTIVSSSTNKITSTTNVLKLPAIYVLQSRLYAKNRDKPKTSGGNSGIPLLIQSQIRIL